MPRQSHLTSTVIACISPTVPHRVKYHSCYELLWVLIFFFKGRKKKHASGFFYVPRTHHVDLGSLEFVILLPQLSAEITDHYP